MLKLKKLGALTAAAALTLSITAVPAAAASFKDVPPPQPGVTPGHWAYEYITKMSNLGLAGGYPDGTFKPEGKMTAAECLLFCARTTGIDSATQDRIAADHADELKKVLPTDMYSWSAKELAVAMEAGVLSLSELEALSRAGALGKTITRENICLYLVRAMQLETLAKSLTTYTLNFKDSNAISPSLRPYVYVLNSYGIVNGVEGNLFDPQGKVTRAQMTTMLSRAVSFMESTGIEVELPEYSDYGWKAGVITAVSPGTAGAVVLALDNDLSGKATYSLAAGVKVYKDNMVTSFSDLKVGQYVRLNLSPSGAIREARLGGALTTYLGSITQLDKESISLQVGGTIKHFDIGRFTEVLSGTQAGGRELIDPKAGYSSAMCYVDAHGQLVGLKLSGGTQVIGGLIRSVSVSNGVTTVNVSGADGLVTTYTIPSSANVTVNGVSSALNSTLEGKYIELRVDRDSKKAISAVVDTQSKYIQGPVSKLGSNGHVRTLYIKDSFTHSLKEFPVNGSTVVTFNGAVSSVSQIDTDWYVTVRLENDTIAQVDGWPGKVTVNGVLDSITYGKPTVLKVRDSQGAVTSYELDIDRLPSIYRGDKLIDITSLYAGDKVEIRISFNEISRIEAEAQEANVTGTISSISMTMEGTKLELKLPDGTTATYTAPEGVPVRQGSTYTTLRALAPGYTVGLVTSGSNILSIEITDTVSQATQITGTVYTTSASGSTQTITVLVNNASGSGSAPITVNVSTATKMSLSGTGLSLSDFSTGDSVICYGSYSGASFVATIVIRQR